MAWPFGAVNGIVNVSGLGPLFLLIRKRYVKSRLVKALLITGRDRGAA